MSEVTAIGWCDHTFNIAWGCEQVSPGCAHCYAKAFAVDRLKLKVWGPASVERRTFGAKHWAEPLKWNRKAIAAKERRRVFSSSMADIFEDNPTIDAEREKLWPLIRATPQLDWLLLTKRSERIEAGLPDDWGQGYTNVWLGVSVENQRWTSRIEDLVAVPARVRFLSCEPLLGPIDLIPWLPGFASDDRATLDWVIAGGESGADRREMQLDWLTDLHEDCASQGVPFYAKQDSAPKPGQQRRIPIEHWVHEFPAPRAA